MQIPMAADYLMLMSKKYVHFKKRQKHVPRIFFSFRRSNWIHVLRCVSQRSVQKLEKRLEFLRFTGVSANKKLEIIKL